MALGVETDSGHVLGQFIDIVFMRQSLGGNWQLERPPFFFVY
jgi:hypothetical protein